MTFEEWYKSHYKVELPKLEAEVPNQVEMLKKLQVAIERAINEKAKKGSDANGPNVVGKEQKGN